MTTTKISAEYIEVGMTLKTYGAVTAVERKNFLGSEMIIITAVQGLTPDGKRYAFQPKDTAEVI